MKKKFMIFISIIILFSLNFCSDSKNNEIVTPSNPESLKKTEITLKGFIPFEQMQDTFIIVKSNEVNPKAADCFTKVIEGWVIHHFDPKNGKNIGIWPKSLWYQNPSYLQELRKYGYRNIFHQGDYSYFTQATNNGFNATNIMCGISISGWSGVINQYGNVMGYYLDEPYTHSYSLSTLTSIYMYIHTNTNAKFYIGDYKPCQCFDVYSLLCDEVYVSTYSNWYETIFTCVFLEGSNDQRELWNTMHNRYSNKNLSNWINLYKDVGEFSNLCGKANNLNLNKLWTYQLDDNSNYVMQSQHLMQFSNSAWYAGYLRRYSQYTYYYYRCLDDTCEECQSEEGSWQLYEVIYGAMREDIPN